MDAQPLGVLCAHAMQLLEERYADRDAIVRTVALVVEVEDGEDCKTLVTATDNRLWLQAAFLREGIVALEDEIDRQAHPIGGDE